MQTKLYCPGHASRRFSTFILLASLASACGGQIEQNSQSSDADLSRQSTDGSNGESTGNDTSSSPSQIVRLTADRPLGFHWVLGAKLDLSDPVQMGLRDFYGNTLPEPDVYDIDGEYNDKSVVDALHAKGKIVICYFDAGVYETYRSDAWKFEAIEPRIWGSEDKGWDRSYWLDFGRVSELEPIMRARIQMCKEKGFDAIEPDEIDGWQNDNGFYRAKSAEGYDKQLAYNKALAGWAHEAGMSIGLKGNIGQAHDLYDVFDWVLNEECFMNNECLSVWDEAHEEDVDGLTLFTEQNKAVFIAEYPSEYKSSKRDSKGKALNASTWSSFCATSSSNRFNTIQFVLGLPNNGGRLQCDKGW